MIRVAVFGGDGRGYLVERADEKCVVTAYEGDASNAERVAQATRQGSFTHVVALKRWMDHPQWHKLRDACKETKDVTFVTWPRGLGSLKSEIESWIFKDQTKPFALLGKEAKEVTRGKAEEIWLNDNTVHVLPKEEAMQEFETSNGVIASSSTATEKKDFRGVTTHVREAFAIDPRKEWTVRALSEFLYSTEDNQTMQVIAAKLRRMELTGEIRAVGGVAKSATNPRRFVLATAPEIIVPLDKTSNGQIMEIATPTPTPTLNYVVIGALGKQLFFGTNREEMLSCLRANPGARLFREVKLRVTVEIDE